MLNLCKAGVVVAAVVCGVAVPTSAVSADPLRGHEAVFPINVTCDGADLTLVSANEPTPVGHVVDDTSVVVVSSAHLEVRYQDPASGEAVIEITDVTYGAGHGRADGVDQRSTVCTGVDVVEDPDLGTVTFDLSLTVVRRP